MLMAWSEQMQLVERFHAVTNFLKQTCKHWELGKSYEGWVTALAREQERLVPLVIQRLRRHMQSMTNYQRCGRWEAYAVDGSEFACPRTEENQQAMGEVGKPNGMPLVSLTILYHLRLGLPWALRVGPGTDSERAHLRDMVPELPSGSLLVADAGFVGYDLCRSLLAQKQHFLLRVGGNIHLLNELGYGWEVHRRTVYLWPLDQQKQNQPPLELRLIVCEDEGKQPVYLLTSLLDPDQLTDEEASELYRLRWGIEVFYRTTKQTLERRTLRSRTPENCYLELTWTVLGVWLLQLMTVRRVVGAGYDASEASPAQARTLVRRVLRHQKPSHRTRRALCELLADCRQDHYVRKNAKTSRDYPRKKRHKPPGPPNLKAPNEKQIQTAKRLTPITIAA
jgi:hypothetical protein